MIPGFTTTTKTSTLTTATAITSTEAPNDNEDTVVILTAGWINDPGRRGFSTEIYPPVSGCSLPALPSGKYRYYHATFATTGPNPKIVTCGGVDATWTRSCFALDLQNQLWDESVISRLPQNRGYPAAVSMENIGTYLIGGEGQARTSDFLAQGTTEWTAGPEIPLDMDYPCAIKISDLSFLVIHNTDILEYQVDILDPTSNSGWQSATKWPQLQTDRSSQPGCSKIENYVVIAGGRGSSGWLSSTEVLDLSTRAIVYAGDMNSPRGHFHLATITRNGQQMLLAFGGHPGNLNSVEQFFPNNNTWTVEPTTMEETRRNYGAVAVPKKLICPT